MNEQWRVVLLTNTIGSVVSLLLRIIQDAGHRPVVVVTTPGPKRRASETYLEVVAATPPDVDVIVTNRVRRLARVLEPYRIDLGITFGFPWIFPDDLINLPRFGMINFHDSLLPKYRGVNAAGWQFRNDEPYGGMTLHRMTPELDRGNILAQIALPLQDDEDFASATVRFLARLPDLFEQAFARIASGDPGDPQDESQATYASPFEADWREIVWDRPARLIHNQVRSWIGFRDFPRGAWATVDQRRVLVLKTSLITDEAPSPITDVPPGTVLTMNDDCIEVQCADRPLRVIEWEWEM